jgi:hypothetical protein
MLNLSPEEHIVLSLSQPMPSDRAVEQAATILSNKANPVNYDTIIRLANLNQTTPILYKNLKGLKDIPEDVLTTLKKSYLSTFYYNSRHLKETLKIISLLQEGGIKSIPLKGSFSSDVLLGDLGLYPTSDIDILVRPSDLEKTKGILSKAGYYLSEGVSEQDQMKGTYHITFQNGAYVIEVHWNLVMRYFNVSPDFWWEDISEMSHEGLTVLQLVPEKYLLYLIFRLYARAFVPLRYFVFITGLMNKKEVDWMKLLSYAEELKMKRLISFTLRLLREMLDIELPDTLLQGKVYGYSLLRNAVIKGLFNHTSRTHLHMLSYTILLDSPIDIAGVLLRRIFPSVSEIRFRYRLPEHSMKTYPYYVLNPFLLMLRRHKR